jgi:hypothetical protein
LDLTTVSYQESYNPQLPWPGQAPLPPLPKKRAVKLWLVALVGVAAVAGIVVTVFLTTGGDHGSSAGLEKVQQSCGLPTDYAVIGDNGRTLTLDGQGKEDSGGLSWSDIECTLDGVKMPASIRGQLGSTRALDGMQHASWDSYAATWNYHPDSGVNLIITIVK